VLLVDDDERNLLAVANVLEDLGEVVLARSGDEALRHLLKDEFAVILLDVYMPGMDGYETAQIIRGREQTKGIPIVFLSAVNKEAEHLLRGYSMGAVDYVFKPVEPVVLRSKVAVFVDLFAKTKEIERKARQEQALLDANLRANAERLRAEQELRRAEQRQAAIIQSLPMVLYLEPYDANQRLPNYVSGNLEAITGFTQEQVLKQPHLWNERLHADDRDRVIAAIEARRRSGRLSVEYRWQCADGGYKHFLDQAVLVMTKRAAEQGSELVRRLLAFARRQKREPRPIDLAALQEAVWDLLTHTLGGLVDIEWCASEGSWNAFADQTQLELALVNLII